MWLFQVWKFVILIIRLIVELTNFSSTFHVGSTNFSCCFSMWNEIILITRIYKVAVDLRSLHITNTKTQFWTLKFDDFIEYVFKFAKNYLKNCPNLSNLCKPFDLFILRQVPKICRYLLSWSCCCMCYYLVIAHTKGIFMLLKEMQVLWRDFVEDKIWIDQQTE